jgi:LPS-assembly protein
MTLLAAPAVAQDLQNRPVDAPPPSALPAPAASANGEEQVQFSANTLEYDSEADIVTATGDVRMFRQDERLRGDKVVWNRTTGRVIASGNVAVTNPQGDVAYGDSIELSDSLRDGVVQDMLIVLERGGRLAAERGRRDPDGTVELERAAYTPCAVETTAGCPKEPTWKITAIRVTYRPDRRRVYYAGGRIELFGLPTIPLPAFSHPIGDGSDSGLLSPDVRYGRVNGLSVAVPYYWQLGPDKGLTLTPRLYSNVLPLLQAQYQQLTDLGAVSLTGYGTYSRRSDDLSSATIAATERAFRGYLDGTGRFQLSPEWSLATSLRLVTDRTFLRRYDISRDDRLRTTASLQRIDADSYFALQGWAVQTLRADDRQGLQPVALPELDYRRRFTDPLLGGRVQLQLNTLAIGRAAGQDTQRAFASAQWDMRRLTRWGQELTLTALARTDVYRSNDLLTSPLVYRGESGVQTRAIGLVAADLKWPLIGSFLGGTQRLTPRLQVVAAPRIRNFQIPNEDSRSVDLDDSNLFSLNRFPGYDRFEDSTRVTYGGQWAVALPSFTFETVIGQSYRLNTRPAILYPGTGLADRFSDLVGRSEIRFRELTSIVHRYRLDKDSFTVRRNEIDATIGSRSTYALLGYIRLNRDIFPTIEDLQDREEARIAGRLQFARFWSAFASAIVDLTDRREDSLSVADGFDPVRHRLGVQYEDDCLRLGLTWRRDYRDTGDARSQNSFLLTLAFTNLGR